MFIVLDVDGTLADNTHRQHFLKEELKNWDSFFAPDAVMRDTVVKGANRAVDQLRTLKHDLLVITGRHEALRDTTMRWLLENFDLSLPDTHLMMRANGNMLNASEYKREQLINFKASLENKDAGFIFIDDDAQICNTLQPLAITMKAPECWSVLFPA
jgi:regulator of replication initiation timing